MRKIQFTKTGYEQLLSELDGLIKVKKPGAAKRLERARLMGDLKENSEYSAAKSEFAFIEGRIREIEEIMRYAEVIELSSGEGVQVGTVVTVDRVGKTETYMIVGEFEADPAAKKLSATSPIGRALIGRKTGESVEIDVPAGKLVYKIIKIESGN